MAKILTDCELAEIVQKATHGIDVIDSATSYKHFLSDLASLVCSYFGGQPGSVGCPDGALGWTVGIHIDECVPPDGGVFKYYDTDVTWENGEERE